MLRARLRSARRRLFLVLRDVAWRFHVYSKPHGVRLGDPAGRRRVLWAEPVKIPMPGMSGIYDRPGLVIQAHPRLRAFFQQKVQHALRRACLAMRANHLIYPDEGDFTLPTTDEVYPIYGQRMVIAYLHWEGRV